MNIIIVPAEEKYIDNCIRVGIRAWEAVHKFYAACIGEDLHEELFGSWQETKTESIRQTWADGAFVALADDRVVGYVIYKINNILGKIQDNAVDPDFWGQGINTKLGEAALDAMRSAGCKYAAADIKLGEGGVQARRSYGKLGFERNLPAIMYYQRLDPDMQPYATCSDMVQVIPCEEKHLDDCVRIAQTAWDIIHNIYIQHLGKKMHDELNAGWQESLTKDILAAQMGGRGYVAIVDGKVAGFAAYRLDGNRGHIGRNAVDPAYRGRGIAKLLYGQLINGMIAEGCRYTIVHTGLDDGHAGARKAYGKVGFQLNLSSAVYYREL